MGPRASGRRRRWQRARTRSPVPAGGRAGPAPAGAASARSPGSCGARLGTRSLRGTALPVSACEGGSAGARKGPGPPRLHRAPQWPPGTRRPPPARRRCHWAAPPGVGSSGPASGLFFWKAFYNHQPLKTVPRIATLTTKSDTPGGGTQLLGTRQLLFGRWQFSQVEIEGRPERMGFQGRLSDRVLLVPCHSAELQIFRHVLVRQNAASVT
jgi:hypothetical protein